MDLSYPPSAPHLVLVAEDDQILGPLFARVLRAAGLAVHLAIDGREASLWLTDERPDAVVLDVNLPHVDGRDILSRMRRDPRLADVPVLVVTGRDDEYTRDTVLSLGARDVLEKPIGVDELVHAVRGLLERAL